MFVFKRGEYLPREISLNDMSLFAQRGIRSAAFRRYNTCCHRFLIALVDVGANETPFHRWT